MVGLAVVGLAVVGLAMVGPGKASAWCILREGGLGHLAMQSQSLVIVLTVKPAYYLEESLARPFSILSSPEAHLSTHFLNSWDSEETGPSH